MSKSPHNYQSQAVIWCLPEVFSGYSEPQAFVNSRESNGPDYMSRQSGDSTRRHPVTAVTGGQCPGSKHAGGPHTFGGAQGVIVDRMKEATDPELVQLDPAQGGPAGWLAHTPRRAGRVQQGCDA